MFGFNRNKKNAVSRPENPPENSPEDPAKEKMKRCPACCKFRPGKCYVCNGTTVLPGFMLLARCPACDIRGTCTMCGGTGEIPA